MSQYATLWTWAVKWPVNDKGKLYSITCYEDPDGELCYFFNLGPKWGWVVNAVPRLLYSWEWHGTHSTGGWVGAENRATTGIWSLYRPAASRSLYWLSYTGSPSDQCTAIVPLVLLFQLCFPHPSLGYQCDTFMQYLCSQHHILEESKLNVHECKVLFVSGTLFHVVLWLVLQIQLVWKTQVSVSPLDIIMCQ